MPSTEQLRDDFHVLEGALDATARDFAGKGVVVTREHLGEVCLTAQNARLDDDARFDFRDIVDAPCEALRFLTDSKTLRVEFRREGSEAFGETIEWALFDTLSKLLILEGAEVAAGGA